LFALLLLFLFVFADSIRAELASPVETRQVCENWLAQIIYQQGHWAGETNPEIILVDEIEAGGILLARCYHISPEGFVIVPALKEMSPVKAYSDRSRLDEKQAEGFLSLIEEMLYSRMDLYRDLFGSLDASQPDSGQALFGRSQRQAWDRFTQNGEGFAAELDRDNGRLLTEAGPLLTTSWHQYSLYNSFCPWGDGARCKVGCVATAVAQVMNFWQWPDSGVGSHSYYWEGDFSCGGSTEGDTLEADFSDLYDWANMPDSCDNGCSPEDTAALAELNYEVGVALENIYGACGTGAYAYMVPDVIRDYFGYDELLEYHQRHYYSAEEWFSMIKTEINWSRPILYYIHSHAIVCDGYREQTDQFEYHMNYGWGNQFTAWYVLDSLYCYWIPPDSICPAMYDAMITHVKPITGPSLELVGQTLYDTLGNGDGHASAGETVEISAKIINTGGKTLYMVNGELSCDDPNIYVTISSASFTTSLHTGETAESQTPFRVEINPSCPDPLITVMNLELTSTGGLTFADSFYLHVGDTEGFSDDMESNQGYWTHEALGEDFLDQWHLENYRYNSDETSWKVGGSGSEDYADGLDAVLITPPSLLPEDATLSFWHWIDAEAVQGEKGTAMDGGLVMISSGDGEWYQLYPESGYPYNISGSVSSPFEEGTPCFSGSQDWSQVKFDLSAYSGVVYIMFRFGSDGYNVGEGWYIDDVEIQAVNVLCGDANGDDEVNVSDAVFIINYVFVSGSPVPDPLCIADCNGDNDANVSDAVYIINYVFVGGPPPQPDCCD
jgi:hypothetical protein